ncbi:YveK family protein [Thermoclostridium caenicola]|uniref:Capsular polysaccharide biosynthesis protein n=1 Tax=Thermoclostridium caenicola TaxID=659425 RepID=A0A1M6J393_9FIRM|nr:Wzz/FepE/Etk N-terminal domain-containing protein [Thermoclostridium caenicola]SHJ41142.1 Capsular polysaccharide biosynthesis protein [Thermoclostridium caenicola]
MNLKEIMHLLLRKWWVILLFIILFGSLSYVMTNYYMVPVYTANTTLYVGKNADEQGMSLSELNIGASVVLDYREIARSRLVASTVIEELNLEDISAKELANSIRVQQRPETRVIEISVSHTDPQMAMDITNKVAEVFQEKIVEIMQVSNVQVIDRAELPERPSFPNKRANYIIGVLLGLMLSAGIILLIEYLDDTIKTSEDAKKYLNLPVIGTIPSFSPRRKEK